MFEQKIDRMVINVKSSIADAGGTALEVLEKSPGVTINRQNNNIALNGKNGVTVMINGRISYMPADALVQFLAGIPAGNIEKIELITTPPTKYDAGGNGGYINIILINNPYAGFSGSYFIAAGYGDRESGAAGINFNYKTARVNFSGNYTYTYNHTIQTSTAFTRYVRAGNIFTNNSFSYRDAISQVQNLRIGMDYQLNTSTTIGVLMSGYNSRWFMIASNGVTINQNNALDTTIISVDHPELNLWQNATGTLSFQHAFKPGQRLYIDVNYIYYRDNNPNNYSTDFYGNTKEILFHEDLRSGKITPIHFQVYSADYTTPLGKKITMEAGVKMSLSDFTNEVNADYLKQGNWIPDFNLSAKYSLKENTGAAYASFNISLNSKLSMRAGLRYEYTTSDLSTKDTAHILKNKYGELFPTIYFSRRINENNSINISYSRRINRPAFNDLAPFTIFFDPKTFYSGNPALQPAIANTIQAGYGFRNANITLSYTYETNTIGNFYFQVQKVDTTSGIVYLSPRNFNSAQYLTSGISLPVTVNKWWTMQNNITLNWRQVNSSYERAPVILNYFDYSLYSTQHFTLAKDLSFELTGLYSSAGYQGTEKIKPLYQFGAGLQKKLGNKRDILRLTANDVFNSGSNFRITNNLPVAGVMVGRNFNFRLAVYKITYTHNFGTNTLKVKTERSTGAEDELNRVHN
jgi:outer membrane receptor protein involved in Fe transport